MGFVLKRTSQRTSAFGLLVSSPQDVRRDIVRSLERAVTETRFLAMPTNKGFPLQRLRRSIAHAMRLDVLFSRRLEERVINTKIGASFPTRKIWVITPLWKVANRVHYHKADKLCSLLHSLATLRRMPPGLVHDLVRMSIHVWNLTLSQFDGLCRRILSKIGRSLKEIGSSPDPLERMGSLSNNPILRNRVNRNPPVQRKKVFPRVKPKSLVVLIQILGERQKRLDARASSVYKARTKVQLET